RELGVIGLMNVQFAVKGSDVYVLEVNPRASRTVPFVSKCIGVSLAKVAARCMAGMSLQDQGFTKEIIPNYYSVKEAVFPFAKFPGVDPILGPEMKSTGEVMGSGATFAEAFHKAVLGSNERLPTGGRVFLSVRESDKPHVSRVAGELAELGFSLVATSGTQAILAAAGIACERVNKVTEGRPHIVDMLKNGEINFIINTTEGKQAQEDSFSIRRSALQGKVYYTTTLSGAEAVSQSLRSKDALTVRRLQDLHEGL
ncbi:MAG: carbamoyl phosphate synthase large subunit, partial [Paraperlucidibaca sp.]|nr:carbamoyl phosphate synthase large subunit [Paraperlucidibaca sp.]